MGVYGWGIIPSKGTLRIISLVFSRVMKRSLLLLVACLTPSFAELPQMSDHKDWLGYFIGWEGRGFDFGIGADGESLIYPKERGKRVGKDVMVKYIIEEEVNGKWVRRQFLKEGGLSSEHEKGLDPKKPIVFVATVTGDTKVQWTHVPSRGSFSIMPKILEKKTENKIRVGLEFSLPQLYRFDKTPEERELKRKLSNDYLRGVRLKDGKKAKVKFSDLDDDITSDKYLKDGASAIEMKCDAMKKKTLIIENGGEKTGRIDVVTKGPLYKSFKFIWMAETEKIGEKDTYVTFEVK